MSGVEFSTTALMKIGATGPQLFVTGFELMVAASPPEAVCSTLVEGLVYERVIISPKETGEDRVNLTFPETIATELTVLVTELIFTRNADVAGTTLARLKL